MRLRVLGGASLLVLAAAPATVLAQDGGGDLAERFGARRSILDVKLSPSGNKVSMVVPTEDNGEAVVTFDLAGDGKRKIAMLNSEPSSDVTWCDWATEIRLICNVRFVDDGMTDLIGFSRLLSVNEDATNYRMISAEMPRRALTRFNQWGGVVLSWAVEGEDPNRVLMSRDFHAEMMTGTRIASDDWGLGAELVDIETGRRWTVEQPNQEAERYIADETGNLRIMENNDTSATGYIRSTGHIMYRPKGGGYWRALEIEGGQPDDFNPVAVDGERDIAYGFGNLDGFDALYAVALDGSGKAEVLLSEPGYDVDHLLTLGHAGRVIGASYAAEKREVAFFDKDFESLSNALGEALGGPAIQIIDASADENKILMSASSDTDPGMVYIFHKDLRQLEEVSPVRPELAGMDMAVMRAVSFPAEDGTRIPGYLTLPPGSDGKGLPAIVIPHGGPGSRDEWGFDWLVQFFAQSGYAVLQPNYRGSAGYGEGWFMENGFRSWRTAVGDVNDAGRWLVSEGIAGPEQLGIVGWSYGGYAALQSAVLDADLYQAIVAIAPVTNLDQWRDDHLRFTNYRLVNEMIGRGEHVTAGSPDLHADAFKAPVLLFHGDLDQNVYVTHSRAMKTALEAAGKQVDYTEFTGLQHDLDDPAARSTMLRQTDAFLKDAFAR